MSEKLYDEVIAPKLLELATLCEEHRIPFVACVEWENDYMARTEFVPPTAGTPMLIATYGARCSGNVDTLFMEIQKLAAERGHRSVVLDLLNTPRRSDRTTDR